MRMIVKCCLAGGWAWLGRSAADMPPSWTLINTTEQSEEAITGDTAGAISA